MRRRSTLILAAVVSATLGLTAAKGIAHETGGGYYSSMRGDGGHRMHGGGHGMHGGGNPEMYGHHEGHGHHAGGRDGMRRGMRMMETFDADGDGRLTQEEVDRVRADRLREFDSDGDGTLSLAEYQALWLDAMHERMVDRFQAHDDDGDGKVTVEEFGRRYARVIRRMDMNGDGIVDESDFGPRRRPYPDDNEERGRGPMHGGN